MRSNTGNHLIRHRLSLWGFGVFDIRSRMFSGQLPFIRRRLVSIWTCKTCPQQEPGGWNRLLLQVQDLPARIAALKEVILGVLIRMVIPSYFQVSDARRQILHLKKHTVPSAGLLLRAGFA